MAFQPCPQIAEIVVRATYFGKPIANTLHALCESTMTEQSLATITDAAAYAWNGYMLPQLSDSYVMGDVVGTNLTEQNSFQVTITAYNGNAGAVNASPGMPANVALAVSLRTNKIGRAYRGRIYVSGCTEADVVGNHFDETWADDVKEAVKDVVGAIATASGWDCVVLSRQLNKVKRNEGVGTPITSVTLTDLVVDSQRRRLG